MVCVGEASRQRDRASEGAGEAGTPPPGSSRGARGVPYKRRARRIRAAVFGGAQDVPPLRWLIPRLECTSDG